MFKVTSFRFDEKTYSEGRTRQAALAPYADTRAVRAALDPTSPLEGAERGLVVTALIREQQTKRRPVWQEILLTAFRPMLLRLRKQLRGESAADRSQEVVLHFLEAVAGLPASALGSHAPVALTLETRRRAFAARLAEERRPLMVPLEETMSYDPFGTESDAPAAFLLADVERIRDAGGALGEQAKLLLEAARDERPSTAGWRERAQRRVAAAELRKRLGEPSPRGGHDFA